MSPEGPRQARVVVGADELRAAHDAARVLYRLPVLRVVSPAAAHFALVPDRPELPAILVAPARGPIRRLRVVPMIVSVEVAAPRAVPVLARRGKVTIVVVAALAMAVRSAAVSHSFSLHRHSAVYPRHRSRQDSIKWPHTRMRACTTHPPTS